MICDHFLHEIVYCLVSSKAFTEVIKLFQTFFVYRLTFWSRHSTKVRKDLDAKESKVEGGKEYNEVANTGSKTKLQLAMEAAEFLYEPKKWKS